MAYGTWKEVPANLCLQTGNAMEAGKQRSAGLPNITGKIVFSRVRNEDSAAEGALVKLFKAHADNIAYPYFWSVQPGEEGDTIFSIDASKSSSIYGKSTTVQPPAYMVRAWVRTA